MEKTYKASDIIKVVDILMAIVKKHCDEKQITEIEKDMENISQALETLNGLGGKI